MDIVFSKNEQQTLAQNGIKAIILFGSQAQNLANEASDVDVTVIGPKNNHIYDLVYEFLSSKINKLINIDIVFLQDAPGELLIHLAKYGQVLYAQNAKIFPDFKQQTMLEYSDFAFHRQIFQNATLARIA